VQYARWRAGPTLREARQAIAENYRIRLILSASPAKRIRNDRPPHKRLADAARPRRRGGRVIQPMSVNGSRVGSRRGPARMMPTFPRSSLSFRTAGFPQYGWRAGFPSGAFPDHQRLKPAPGIRCPMFGLHPRFVHLVATTVVPHCVGPRTRLRTALEGCYSSP